MPSRQRLWQLRQAAHGRCRVCARPIQRKDSCELHWLKKVLWARLRSRRVYHYRRRYANAMYGTDEALRTRIAALEAARITEKGIS